MSITKLEQQLEAAKTIANRGQLAIQLAEVPAFKELILKQFCMEECANYVHMSADSSLTKEQREDALAFAQASGVLKKWLSLIVQMGYGAERDVISICEAIEEERIGGNE